MLDNEDSSRDAVSKNKGGLVSSSSRGTSDSNNQDTTNVDDDDRQALIPRRGNGRSSDSDGRGLLTRDEINEVSSAVVSCCNISTIPEKEELKFP